MSTCPNSIPGCGCNPIFQSTNPNPPPLQLPVTPPNVPPTTYWNTAQTATAVCPAGAPTLSYTVPANTISLVTNDPNGQATVNATALAMAQSNVNLMLTQGGCGVAGALSGLKWLMPATGPLPGRHDVCSDPADVTASVTGNPGQLYTVTFKIRGIVETEKYTGRVGGSASGYLFTCSNPTQAVPAIVSPNPGWQGNEYALVISNPAATYFLNGDADNPDSYCHPIDYTFSTTIYAGATVKLKARSGDGVEEANGYWAGPITHITQTFSIPSVWTQANPITAVMTVAATSSGGSPLFTAGQVIYLGPDALVVVLIQDATHLVVKNLVAANVSDPPFSPGTQLWTWVNPASATDNDITHPIGVLQPFDGQFIQMDVISIS